MTVRVSDEVRSFLRNLAPEPRRVILRALDKVETGESKLEALEEPLDGFHKVKAGRFRVLCAVRANTVFALFAETRSIVYEIATPELLSQILEGLD